jgi:hypothetical protein
MLLKRRVLPTSATDGMIEYVPSVSLARVLAEHRTITRFLHIHHPDASGAASAAWLTCLGLLLADVPCVQGSWTCLCLLLA